MDSIACFLIAGFGIGIITLGIFTLAATTYGAICNYLMDCWSDIAKQGTTILTTIGIALLAFGSIFIYIT